MLRSFCLHQRYMSLYINMPDCMAAAVADLEDMKGVGDPPFLTEI